MVVSDFDAFMHGCTIRGMQNFVNIDPMSASKSPRSRTRHKTWAKVTKNNGWLTHQQDHRTKIPKRNVTSRTHEQAITGSQPSHRCTSRAMRPKDKIAASFHGQCLVARLDTGAGKPGIRNIRNRE